MVTATAVLPGPRSTAVRFAPISAPGQQGQPSNPSLLSTATTAGGLRGPSRLSGWVPRFSADVGTPQGAQTFGTLISRLRVMQEKQRRRKQREKGWAGLPFWLSPRSDVSPYPSCPSPLYPQHLTFASSCDAVQVRLLADPCLPPGWRGGHPTLST